jgi:hypothetical protein
MLTINTDNPCIKVGGQSKFHGRPVQNVKVFYSTKDVYPYKKLYATWLVDCETGARLGTGETLADAKIDAEYNANRPATKHHKGGSMFAPVPVVDEIHYHKLSTGTILWDTPERSC